MKTDARLHNTGFTLIALMIAIALLSIVSTIVYASFFQVMVSTEDARVAAAELRLRQFLAQSFSSNLAQAYGDWRPGAAMRDPLLDPDDLNNPEAMIEDELLDVRYVFQGTNDTGPNGPSDVLTFTSSAPLLGNTGLPGFLKQVTYEVTRLSHDDEDLRFEESTDEESLRMTLEMTETMIMYGPDDLGADGFFRDFDTSRIEDASNDAGYDAPGWTVPIRTFDIEYFDGEEWVEEWDSLAMGRLPWSVRIRANFARPEYELDAEREEGIDPIENPDFELVVAIPSGMGTLQEPPAYVSQRGQAPPNP